MKKYLCFLITALILITNISGVFAFEYAPYIGDGIIKTTSVVFTDVDGIYSKDPNKNAHAIKYKKISYLYKILSAFWQDSIEIGSEYIILSSLSKIEHPLLQIK